MMLTVLDRMEFSVLAVAATVAAALVFVSVIMTVVTLRRLLDIDVMVLPVHVPVMLATSVAAAAATPDAVGGMMRGSVILVLGIAVLLVVVAMMGFSVCAVVVAVVTSVVVLLVGGAAAGDSCAVVRVGVREGGRVRIAVGVTPLMQGMRTGGHGTAMLVLVVRNMPCIVSAVQTSALLLSSQVTMLGLERGHQVYIPGPAVWVCGGYSHAVRSVWKVVVALIIASLVPFG